MVAYLVTMSLFNRSKLSTTTKNKLEFWNLMTIFGITMKKKYKHTWYWFINL